jgi:hypothetical protein
MGETNEEVNEEVISNGNGNNNVVAEEEGDVLGALPATTAATTAVPTNALSKKSTKKSKKPLTEAQKASRKLTRNATLASNEYKAKVATKNSESIAIQKQIGKLLHGKDPVTKKTILATPLEVVRIDTLWRKLRAAQALPNNNNNTTPLPLATLEDAIAAYKDDLATKPKKVKLTSAEKENRKTIRNRMRKVGVAPSMLRLTAYKTKRANLNKLNLKNATQKKTLFNYLKAVASPELKGIRKAKANAAAELEGFKTTAEEELKELRTEAQIKKNAGVNPASIKHLAMLRKAGFRITAKDFKELSTLVKKGEMETLSKDARIKSLITQSAGKDACDRCILTTVFGVKVK